MVISDLMVFIDCLVYMIFESVTDNAHAVYHYIKRYISQPYHT